MTAAGSSDRSARILAVSALLGALLGLSACDAPPAAADGSASTRAPGVYFHNDVVLFNAVGVGSNRR